MSLTKCLAGASGEDDFKPRAELTLMVSVLQRGDMLSILNFCHYMYLPVGANGMIDLGVLSVTTYIHGSTYSSPSPLPDN